MDREDFDHDELLDLLDLDGLDALPPIEEEPPREPSTRRPVEPETPHFTWAMLAVILGISGIKLALFMLADAGAAVATMLVGALFVVAHGAVIFVAGLWFDGHRRG